MAVANHLTTSVIGATMVELIAGFLVLGAFAGWYVLRDASGRPEKVVTDVM